MPSILCFGDSLTWGKCPVAQVRHALADRWPSVVAAALPEVEVVAEGLRGRTTAFDQPTASADMNGARILPVLLNTHAPTDVVAVMLGTNDLYFGGRPERVADGLARIVEIVRTQPTRHVVPVVPRVLLIAPPPMVAGPEPRPDAGMIAASQGLAPLIQALAREVDCAFVDAAGICTTSPLDGVHLDAANTRALGQALVAPLRGLLPSAA